MSVAVIKVYGAPWCPDCRRAKRFLAEHRVALGTGQQLCAAAVIVASGSSYRRLGVPGEADLIGAGVRQFFSKLEESHKPMQGLHMFGGLPVSAAVTLVRSLKAADLRPALVLYDLVQAATAKR